VVLCDLYTISRSNLFFFFCKLDSKGQAVHVDLNKFVSCLVAVELMGGGSKLINWVLYADLSVLGVYIIMHIFANNSMLTLIVRNWLLLEAIPVVVG
jgi:hypothetical protein